MLAMEDDISLDSLRRLKAFLGISGGGNRQFPMDVNGYLLGH